MATQPLLLVWLYRMPKNLLGQPVMVYAGHQMLALLESRVDFGLPLAAGGPIRDF